MKEGLKRHFPPNGGVDKQNVLLNYESFKRTFLLNDYLYI